MLDATTQLDAYLEGAIAERRATPRNDLISALTSPRSAA
jgi:cytochrome P450